MVAPSWPPTANGTPMNPTLRTFLPFAVVAALLVAIGYWNIRPESFMERTSTPRNNFV